MAEDLTGLGGLGKALKKLVEVLASGAGTLYAPKQLVRMAHAKVEADLILAEGERELRRLAAEAGRQDPGSPSGADVIEGELVGMEDAAPIPLVVRAERRARQQEAKREQNRRAVALGAAKLLEGVDDGSVSDEPVDEDWIARFFGAVQDVSNEGLRSLWAQLLAREVRQPGACSLRTLDVLRNMSRDEALILERFAPLATDAGHVFKVGAMAEQREQLPDWLRLIEAGLLRPDVQFLSLVFEHRALPEFIVFHDVALQAISPADGEPTNLPMVMLSEAGCELVRAMARPADSATVRRVGRELARRGFMVTLHRRVGPDKVGAVEAEIGAEETA